MMDRSERVHVRVGGGTCSLDEFLARNLDKAERMRYSTPGKMRKSTSRTSVNRTPKSYRQLAEKAALQVQSQVSSV